MGKLEHQKVDGTTAHGRATTLISQPWALRSSIVVAAAGVVHMLVYVRSTVMMAEAITATASALCL